MEMMESLQVNGHDPGEGDCQSPFGRSVQPGLEGLPIPVHPFLHHIRLVWMRKPLLGYALLRHCPVGGRQRFSEWQCALILEMSGEVRHVQNQTERISLIVWL